MHDLQDSLNHQLLRQLQLIRNKNLHPFMDWVALERIVLDQVAPGISNFILEKLEVERESTRKLQARLNQLSFGNDPGRDKRIIEQFNEGLSRGKIAKAVGMSKWGVSKALRRPGATRLVALSRDLRI